MEQHQEAKPSQQVLNSTLTSIQVNNILQYSHTLVPTFAEGIGGCL